MNRRHLGLPRGLVDCSLVVLRGPAPRFWGKMVSMAQQKRVIVTDDIDGREDAKSYTKPFTVRINQRLLPDEEPIEFICHENQQFRKRVKID